MNIFSLKNKKNGNQKGFTLIELLVSIAIFSIVLVVILGTIITIIDTNRKARTLTEVMNNLNFAIENLTRTLKTSTTLEVTGTSMVTAKDQNQNTVVYRCAQQEDDSYILEKQTDGIADNQFIPVLSNDVILDVCFFTERNTNLQPRVFFVFKGRVETTRNISSEFNIQSTVSQRQLEIE